jgi:hypothetical protein
MLTVVAVVGLAGCTTSAVVTTSPGPTGRESIAPSPVLSDPSAPHAVCIDQLGDVTGLDLASATLTLEGASLDFTVTTATPPQGHAAYDVELVDRNAQPLYNFSIVLDAGTTTFAGTDFATNATFTLATPPRLSGDTVSGSIPLTDLPHLPSVDTGFGWSAVAGGTRGSDRCPDAGADTTRPAMESFPG